MKIIAYSILVLLVLATALFIGHTTINYPERPFIKIEKPLTAILFVLTVITAVLKK